MLAHFDPIVAGMWTAAIVIVVVLAVVIGEIVGGRRK